MFRSLTMNPPRYVDIEECEDEDDGAEDRSDDSFEK